MENNDTSDLVQIEQEIVQRLRQIDQNYATFLNQLCFDLRGPLSAIIGYSQLLLENRDEPLTEIQKDQVKAIEHYGRALLELQYDVLDMTRMAMGFLHLNLDSVDLKKIIKETIPASYYETDSSIRIEQSIPDDLPMIRADGRRVGKIFQNLFFNLVRLTEEGRIILTITYNNDEVIISVANTSAVIPTSSLAILNSVDVPVYWRMDYNDWELAASCYLIKQHGGKMHVESQEGKGSTVTFTLPIQNPEYIER